ncbi:MAG: tyrosine-type recombinase/integrase [Clostridia bacterium]
MDVNNQKYVKKLDKYIKYLREEEKCENTIVKYERDIKVFLEFSKSKTLNKTAVIEFKDYLKTKYVPASSNSMLAAVNSFLQWLGKGDLKVKPLKIQRNAFLDSKKELSIYEYERLVMTAKNQNNEKLALIIQTICCTGIRVSELKFIDVESTITGEAKVSCKGKNRTVFLPKKLRVALKRFCSKNSITIGSVFVTKNSNPLDRTNIWKMMKRLCKAAKVDPQKVFPHNLRHLFARTYYKIEKDISSLADVLGHSNINTTRIYTAQSSCYHAKRIEKMKLAVFLA